MRDAGRAAQAVRDGLIAGPRLQIAVSLLSRTAVDDGRTGGQSPLMTPVPLPPSGSSA